MSKTVIKVENLSKLYRLGQVGTGTVSHDLNRWFAKIRGKEDPFALVGQVNDRSKKAESDYVWSLKDINFEVKQGEVLGIIGKNGAGKSTLLKLLSQITSPTTGEIKVKGRIAALLEVGTGMHPEMTARENIYLNGAILGMRKQEIKAKFDEIVEFSGCAMYVDTPIKRFSSGMRVRLGFAVAAFLEPEILIVDEVLAVGDAEFQKKAIGKMKEVSESGGRTVLFVSHNMGAVQNLCTRGLVLQNGGIVFNGDIKNAVGYYLNQSAGIMSLNKKWEKNDRPGNENIRIKSVEITPLTGKIIDVSSGFNINYKIENFKEHIILGTTMQISTSTDVVVLYTGFLITEKRESQMGEYSINFEIPADFLNSGMYKLSFKFGENQQYLLFAVEDLISFEVENVNIGSNYNQLPGILKPNLKRYSEFKNSSNE